MILLWCWQGEFKLVLIVKNRVDMFTEPLVDFITTIWSLAGDKGEYESREFPGEMGRSSFRLSARVDCTNHTQGSYCNESKGKELSRPRPRILNHNM